MEHLYTETIKKTRKKKVNKMKLVFKVIATQCRLLSQY